MDSSNASGTPCFSIVVGFIPAFFVALITFVLVAVTNEPEETIRVSEYGWSIVEYNYGPVFLLPGVLGIVTWVVASSWIHGYSKNARSKTNRPAGFTYPVRIPAERQPLPRGVKERLYRAWGGRCAGCRDVFRQIGNLQVDHIRPVALGGTNDLYNLQLLCRSCNEKKGTGTMQRLLDQLRRDGIRR